MPDSTRNPRGGQRQGAGRKKGSSPYGESTQAIRVPESWLPRLKALLEARKCRSQPTADNRYAIFFPTQIYARFLPLFTGKVAGETGKPAFIKVPSLGC